MMGIALDRYLPGRNAMLGNESYVIINQTIRYTYRPIVQVKFQPCYPAV
jgi:hypothetical protein